DVAGGHRDRADAAIVAGLRHVDRVFQEDGRVVVGERDAAAAELLRPARDLFRGRGVRERIHLARLRHVPVLAEPAAEVAARGSEGEHAGPRQEVVERLLLDRVHAEPARAAVRREHDLIAIAGAIEDATALYFVLRAVERTDGDLDASVGESHRVAAE